MAKLATLAALLAGLMLVSFAAATVTTVEVDVGQDENYSWRFGGGCREQLEQADELRHCEDFLREQVQEGGFERRRFGREDPYQRRERFEDEEERRRFRREDPYERQERRGSRFEGEEGRGSRRLRNCCQQLRQLDDQCRCQGLREIVMDQQQRLRGLGEEREELERIAENLPRMCGVGHERCDIRRGGFGRLA